MQDKERFILQYRPILGYHPEYGYIVPTRELDATVSSLPTELKDVMSIAASSLIEEGLQLQTINQQLIDELEDFLGQDLPGDISLAEYLKARQETDRCIMRQFEDFHREELNGNLPAEALIIFLDLAQAIQDTLDFAQAAFYNGPVATTELKDLKAQEAARYDRLIATCTAGEIPDLLPLSYEAQIKSMIKNRIENIQSFQERIVKTLYRTTNESLDGNVQEVVEDLTVSSVNLDALKMMASTKWRRDASFNRTIYNRQSVVGNRATRNELQQQILTLREIRLNQVASLITWMQQIKKDSATTILADNLLDSMLDIDKGLDTAILELSKIDSMEFMTWEDIYIQIDNKKTVKQIYQLINSIQILFNFTNSNSNKEVQRFIQNTGLKNSGSLTNTI